MFGSDELDALRTLLIQVLGPSGFDTRFSLDEQSELFRAATQTTSDDVLEHHYGIVEKNANRLLSARDHLESALRLSATLPNDLSSVRESPQNIENTLAHVIGKLAHEAAKRGDLNGANQLFNDAAEHFIRARSGNFPNAAAYDAHARMLMDRAARLFAKGSSDHLQGLIEVLDVLSDGIDNVNDEFRPELVGLQAGVLDQLGQRAEAIADLAKRSESAQPRESARYEVMLARIVLGGEAAAAKRKNQTKALSYVIHACEHDPAYFSAWKLRSELHLLLHPEDTEDLVKYLDTALRNSKGVENSWVLYELAVAYFTLSKYEPAASTFAKLRRVTGGHNRAATNVEVAGARGEKDPFEFRGRVVRGERRNGYFVKCDDLAAFGELFFNPRAERFYTPRIGDQVAFTVGFNYRGVAAVDVKRL